jgi:hypothetical protein
MSPPTSLMRLARMVGVASAFAGIVVSCSAKNPPGLGGVYGSYPDGSVPACFVPSDGCSCSQEGAKYACGSVVNRSGDYVACSMGERTCEDGTWSACKGQQVTTKYAPVGGLKALDLGTTQACAGDNPCDPYCNEYIDSPRGITAPPGFTVGPGGLTLMTVAGPCTNLTGTIMDPGKHNPVYGANVYVPTTPVMPFPAGVACDTCANLISGTPGAQAVTGPDGTFNLQGVPPGVAFPLVIQVGRWRRQVTVPAIPMCGTAVLAAEAAHLPATHTLVGDTATDTAAPDIPFVAIGTGQGDAVECLLQKMGIANSEFTNPGGGGRFEMYVNSGAKINGATPAVQTLWDSPTNLAEYQALLMPCDLRGHPPSTTTAVEQANVATYINGGGRLFASHWGSWDFLYGGGTGPFTSSATFAFGQDTFRPGPNMTADVDQTTQTGMDFATWLTDTGSSPSPGKIVLSDWRDDIDAVPASSTRWIYGSSPVTGRSMVSVFSFDTPVAAPPASQCGRVVIPEMHVSNASAGTFPGECPGGAMSPQEKSFEFLLFQTTACLSTTTPPPPLMPATFTRTFQATCPAGTHVEWEFFSWQATIPLGTNITFTAQTAATPGGLAAAPVVGAGLASMTTMTWTSDPNTIAWHLANDVMPGLLSQNYLQVNMTFNPTATIPPSLLNWRQMYDCPPTE